MEQTSKAGTHPPALELRVIGIWQPLVRWRPALLLLLPECAQPWRAHQLHLRVARMHGAQEAVMAPGQLRSIGLGHCRWRQLLLAAMLQMPVHAQQIGASGGIHRELAERTKGNRCNKQSAHA